MDSFARDAVYDMIIVLSVIYCIFYSFILIKITPNVYIDFKSIELPKRHYIKKKDPEHKAEYVKSYWPSVIVRLGLEWNDIKEEREGF